MSELVSKEHKEFIVRNIRDLLPSAVIRAFGSRIRGDAKQYSDLDLALEMKSPIPLQTISALQERFASSALPFKVDLVDLSLVDSDFRRKIEENCAVWS